LALSQGAFCSCCFNTYDQDEFVADSQWIQTEGKRAIEQLQGKMSADLDEDAMKPYQETISEYDVLNIALYHPSRKDLMEAIWLINERNRGFCVTNGKISLPQIPAVQVAGMTLQEAREALRSLYRNEIQDVDIFITFRERRSHTVELTGPVSIHSIPIDGKMRLYEVLAKAVLHPEANLFASSVIRSGSPLQVDLNRLIKEGDMSQNIVMKGGDKVSIASPIVQMALVTGAVAAPRPIPLPTGCISLKEALVQAYGIPYFGDKNCIQVIRGGVSNPKIYVLYWKFIIQQPNKNLLLIPGDVVHVSLTPITEWNVFLSQLQGTIKLFFGLKIFHEMTK
jgi:polysaccharide export outer membrane protein